MAITFVGSHVGTHAATSAQTVNFSSLLDESGGTPTILEGDYVLVAVEVASTVNRTQAQLTPSGYTALHTDDYRNDTHDSNFLVSAKWMGATPDTTVDIPATNDVVRGVAYAIYVFRGVDTVTPMDATVVVTGNTNGGVANAAAITPVTAGAWIIAFGGAAAPTGADFTNPSGMSTTTNHFRSATLTSTTSDPIIGGAIYTGWTSGAYDPATFGGGNVAVSSSWSAVTIALRPAAGGGGTTEIAPAAGAVSYSGYAPAVALTLVLSPSTGSFTITGYAPTLAQPNALAPAPGSVSFTGHIPAVGQSTTTAVEPLAGSISFTGYAPALAQPNAVQPATAALAYTGDAPSILQPNVIAPTGGAILITGYAPGIAVAVVTQIAPGAGSMFFTGYTPTIAQPRAIQPVAANLLFTSYAPGIFYPGTPGADYRQGNIGISRIGLRV